MEVEVVGRRIPEEVVVGEVLQILVVAGEVEVHLLPAALEGVAEQLLPLVAERPEVRS